MKSEKTYIRKKARKQHISVPKCCQQPRSNGCKPRTDFSLYFSNSSSHINSPSSFHAPHPECSTKTYLFEKLDTRSSRMEFLSGKDTMSSITTKSTDTCQANLDRDGEMRQFTLVQCNTLQNREKGGLSSNSIEMTSSESESHHEALNTCKERMNVQNKSGDAAVLLCSPNKSTSQLTECSDVQATPGSIMWAKTAHQMWWPAKILEGRSAPLGANDQASDGHVLVQYYGNHELAWVDPAEDLSDFDECFEEKSCNPMEAFQQALKQALQKKEDLGFCRQMDSSPDRLINSSQNEQSASQSNKWTESSSSREEDDHLERGRGKRKRKPKVHFDEVIFSNKPTKKLRRYRIMRFLGLAAPVGSPFTLTSRERNW